MSATIKAVRREGTGKGAARKARREGLVPGIMYGALDKPIPLAVNEKEFALLLAKEGESGLIDIVFGEGKGKGAHEKAVIRHVDYDPVSDVPIHVDFMAVAMDRKLSISVPVELVGEPIGVTRDKGNMSQIAYEIEIECLPSDIPHSIKVDVSALGIGGSIHVGDLAEMEGIKFLTGREQTVVTVEAPKAEEEAPAVAPEEVAAAEPEVIGKRKEGEEEGEGE